jgi:hypothetical protein
MQIIASGDCNIRSLCVPVISCAQHCFMHIFNFYQEVKGCWNLSHVFECLLEGLVLMHFLTVMHAANSERPFKDTYVLVWIMYENVPSVLCKRCGI